MIISDGLRVEGNKKDFYFFCRNYKLHVYWHRVYMSEEKKRGKKGLPNEKNENHGRQ